MTPIVLEVEINLHTDYSAFLFHVTLTLLSQISLFITGNLRQSR